MDTLDADENEHMSAPRRQPQQPAAPGQSTQTSMKIFDRVRSKEQLNEYVKAGIPVVVEGVVEGWKAFKLWDLDYLKDVLEDREPFQLGGLTFTFAQFADALPFADALALSGNPDLFLPQLGVGTNHGVAAATELAPDVEYPDLLDPSKFDEVNFWIGKGTTPAHFDAYDNLLCVIRGKKFIHLYEPKWFPNMHVDRFQWSQALLRERIDRRFLGTSQTFRRRTRSRLLGGRDSLHSVILVSRSQRSVRFRDHAQLLVPPAARHREQRRTPARREPRSCAARRSSRLEPHRAKVHREQARGRCAAVGTTSRREAHVHLVVLARKRKPLSLLEVSARAADHGFPEANGGPVVIDLTTAKLPAAPLRWLLVQRVQHADQHFRGRRLGRRRPRGDERFRQEVDRLLNDVCALNGKIRALGGVVNEDRWGVLSRTGIGGWR